jgi:hypothetical protein
VYVTIDPGLATGWALWTSGATTTLIACGLGDPRSTPKHVVTPRHENDDVVHDVWIESPRIYPRGHADPQDIIVLARGAGEWGGIYSVLATTVHYVEPAQWKGQVPKAIHHARVWAELRAVEKDIVDAASRGIAPSKRHNILDAVAMGLWVAKRGGNP